MNTGILCSGLRVIDVDVDDEAKADQIWDVMVGDLGEPAIVRCRSNSHRFAAFYRAAVGKPGKSRIDGPGGAVEILGHGQQVVVDGVHPSGGNYVWGDDQASPATVPLTDLTAITEAQVRAFLGRCSDMFGWAPVGGQITGHPNNILEFPDGKHATEVQKKTAITANTDLSAGVTVGWFSGLPAKAKRAVVMSCLDGIDNTRSDPRDQWVRTVFAVVDAGENGCPDARELALEWSRRGARWSSEADFDKVWNSAGKRSGITVGTLIHLAEAAGLDLSHFRAQSQAPQLADASFGTTILERSDPMNSARQYVEQKHTAKGVRTQHHWRGTQYRWNGSCYQPVDPDTSRADVWKFADAAMVKTKDGSFAPFKPTTAKVADVENAVNALCNLPVDIDAPAWLNQAGRLPAHELLAVKNGLLHLPTRTLYAASPEFFNLNASGVAFMPGAKCPEWERFLTNVWPSDPQAIDTLQEMIGYLLSPDTSQQKLFLVIGPKRSGKGTISRMLTGLIGKGNLASPTLASLSTEFGQQPLIGKSVATINDARFGGRGDQAVAAERLLSLSGEDNQTINRKNQTHWTGQLGARVVIFSNELPRIADASGALASRFILLAMTTSFYGKEDLGMTERLLNELPGILNWALEGYQRLRSRGHFIQPASSTAAIEDLEALGSPVMAFVKERCILGPGRQCSTDDMFHAWGAWCTLNGRKETGTKQSFGRDLKAAVPGLQISQAGTGAARTRRYDGIEVAP